MSPATRLTRHYTDDREPQILGLPEPWFFLAVGVVTAPLFFAAPLLRSIGWFLASLIHEMGHCAASWFFGSPAFPAISLSHQAVTIWGTQHTALVVLLAVAMASAAWRLRDETWRWVGMGLALVLYPLIALTDVNLLLRSLGGHLAEIAFACLALWRCLTGGFTSSPVERGLYGTVGAFLVARNVGLTIGLLASGSARSKYASNGSFGLTNDYLVVAREWFDGSLGLVAFTMTLVGLAALPLAYWGARLSSRA